MDKCCYCSSNHGIMYRVLLFNFLQRLLQSRNPFVSGLRLSFHPIQPICYLFLSPSSLFLTLHLSFSSVIASPFVLLFSLSFKFLFTFPFFTLAPSLLLNAQSFLFILSSFPLSPQTHWIPSSSSLNSALFIPPILSPSHPLSLPSSPSHPIICRNRWGISLKGGWIFDSLDFVSIIQSHPFLHPSFLTHYYSYHSQPLVTHRNTKIIWKNAFSLSSLSLSLTFTASRFQPDVCENFSNRNFKCQINTWHSKVDHSLILCLKYQKMRMTVMSGWIHVCAWVW